MTFISNYLLKKLVMLPRVPRKLSHLFRKYSLKFFLVCWPSHPSMVSAADILSDESEVLYYSGYIWLQVTEYQLSSIFSNKGIYFSHIRESLV